MDNLGQINDASGHEVGSNLLQEMAALLTQTFRNTDAMGRLGGDEFVVAGVTETVEMTRASARLEEAANAANAVASRRDLLSFSVGYVISDPSRTETLKMLVKQADSIMYEAKRTGSAFMKNPDSPLQCRFKSLRQQ
jgi:diguanylate cyclase (GGDEF)-like protein